jgi:hypothetical protein
MKVIKRLVIGLLVVSFIGAALPLTAVEKEMDEKKMMELWKKYSTPGEAHKYLEYFVGKWEITSKSWMKPGAKPMVEKQEMTFKSILGGRHVKGHMKGSIMGMPGEGIMIVGYDNYKKKYTSIWMDNQSTSIYQSWGTLDKSGKIRTDYGEWDDWMTDKVEKVKMISKIVDKNTWVFEMYSHGFKSMEMTYKRK